MTIRPTEIVPLLPAPAPRRHLEAHPVGADLDVEAPGQGASSGPRQESDGVEAAGRLEDEGRRTRAIRLDRGPPVCVAGGPGRSERLYPRAEGRHEPRVDRGLAAARRRVNAADGAERLLELLRRRQVARGVPDEKPRHVLRKANLVQVRQGVVAETLVPRLRGNDALAALVGEPVGEVVGRVGSAYVGGVEGLSDGRQVAEREPEGRGFAPTPGRKESR